MLNELWDTYAAWYTLLVRWASMLVQDVTAQRLARRSLAETFLLACNGLETADGPYMASCDVLYRLISLHRETSGTIFVASAFKAVPVADEALLSDIARLYAATYEATYMANLSLRDREEIVILIRLFDPPDLSWDKIIGGYYEKFPPSHPLRRVVKAASSAPEPAELIQAAAAELWEAEEERGLTWRKGTIDRKGVA